MQKLDSQTFKSSNEVKRTWEISVDIVYKKKKKKRETTFTTEIMK